MAPYQLSVAHSAALGTGQWEGGVVQKSFSEQGKQWQVSKTRITIGVLQ